MIYSLPVERHADRVVRQSPLVISPPVSLGNNISISIITNKTKATENICQLFCCITFYLHWLLLTFAISIFNTPLSRCVFILF